jgi:hypothetical protein
MEGQTSKLCKTNRIAFPAVLLVALSLASPRFVVAQEAPLITITKSDKVAIGLNGISGPDGAGIAQIVQRDLQLSGAFSVGGPNTGSFSVSGAASER